MDKSYLFGDVKAVDDSEDPNGEFEVILSMPTLDRDGEIIAAGAFEPLPESVPFHAFHDFTDPIGRARPYYDGDVLKARGYYASTARAQEIRSLVTDGVIAHTSVGFMAPAREVKDGVPHILSGELLEASFVSVSSNREAAVLTAKSMEGMPPAIAARLKALEDKLDTLISNIPAATDPEKAAAPAAASPAEVPVGKVWSAITEAQTALLLT